MLFFIADDDVLKVLWRRGVTAWPQVVLEEAAFASHLRARRGDAVDEVHAEDLFLACACARGDPTALEAFAATFVARAALQVARGEVRPDDLRQALFESLVYAPAGRSPRIGEYAGRAPLAAWVSVAAARLASNLGRASRRREGRHQRAADEPLAAAVDPELALLKARLGPPFVQAFRDALAGLGREARTLLRLHHLEGLSLDAIASLQATSRSAAHRRLAAAREALLSGTRDLLAARLGLAAGELTSVIRALRSQLGTSLLELDDDHTP